MNTIPLQIKQLLEKYEFLFNAINNQSITKLVYPGNSNLINDYKKISNSNDADSFFAKYCVGNAIVGVHNPFERQIAYELLLQILKSLDSIQYHKIHKGTPYYFIGWTSYQYRDFAKAIFYMDAAVSEDLKFPDVQSKVSPRASLDFFLLKNESGPTGLATHLELRTVIEKTFYNYKTNGGGNITINDFRDKFISDLLYTGPKERSLLTALYTFLLEYQEKEKQINLRSNTGGSIQPFLDHLFDGARILESLLENRCGNKNTLSKKILNTPDIEVNQSVLKANRKLVDAKLEFNNQIAAGSSFQDCNFASAYIIRNTTGHSLLWEDQFFTTNSYSTLYNNLVNSILWSIQKLWL